MLRTAGSARDACWGRRERKKERRSEEAEGKRGEGVREEEHTVRDEERGETERWKGQE